MQSSFKSKDFERLSICNSPTLIRELAKNTTLFSSNMKYDLTPALEQLLYKHNILLQVQYLLTANVNTKTYFYALCTKDIAKFSHENSSHFYIWDADVALWKEEKRNKMERMTLKGFIQSIYMGYY